MTEVLKQNGERENFSEEKFINGLRKAGFDDSHIDSALEKIEESLYEGITTGEIYKKAISFLKKTDDQLPIVKYSLKRSVLELGPTGFPFEKFVARLFSEKGYKTKTGVVLKGYCIEHEIDVIAYKGDELILMETKFHNEQYMKSDTKVALYMKARYDDLSGIDFDIDGKKIKMSRALLITNTGFTENSIEYAECHKVYELISWTYPKEGNLLDLIEESGLHPITCIPVLSRKEKQRLVESGNIYCKDVIGKPHILRENGIKESKIKEIMDIFDLICKEHTHK